MIDMDSRLRTARGIAKNETEASKEVFQTLQQRGHPETPPPFMSDGWGGIDNALVEVYGKVPEYSGVGRPPTQKQPQAGWQYLQYIKHRDEHGRLLNTELHVVFGEQQSVLDLFGKSTAYIERTHLTMRMFNGRLVRQTLAFSKDLQMYRFSAAWEDLVYNFARPLKTLRVENHDVPGRRWLKRSPAMAAKLTNHIWTAKELLKTVVVPNT
jgi:hypothetical protein